MTRDEALEIRTRARVLGAPVDAFEDFGPSNDWQGGDWGVTFWAYDPVESFSNRDQAVKRMVDDWLKEHPVRLMAVLDALYSLSQLTPAQRKALSELSERYEVPFDPSSFYSSPLDLKPGWVGGWIGPVFVGCSPDGEISS